MAFDPRRGVFGATVELGVVPATEGSHRLKRLGDTDNVSNWIWPVGKGIRTRIRVLSGANQCMIICRIAFMSADQEA